jgi:TolB-like protein
VPDIFLSYSREDHAVAARIAAALQQEGLDVWWDQALNAGDAYDRVTEQALESARAVVVLWSKHSVESRWVRAEATTADRLGTFVPVMIEPCKRPIMFELTQSADLSGWKGDRTDDAWRSLVASIRRFLGRAQGAAAAPAAAPAAARLPRGSPARRNVVLGAVAVVAGLLSLLWWQARPHAPQAAASGSPDSAAAPARDATATADMAAGKTSVAVLPFTNMSSDREQEFFADGLSEELLNQLAQLPQLRVIGRTSSFAFKGRNEDLREIGRALGAGHILEGSVRKSGDRVRITAQLIDVANGSHRWSQAYERRLTDIFSIQEEIARAVAGELRVQLAGASPVERGTQNLAAYDAYLAGRARTYEATPEERLKGQAQVEHAVELDPDFVAARIWLVSSYTGAMMLAPQRRAMARTKLQEHIEEIIRRRPDSAEASLARALRAVVLRDYAEAERQYLRYGEQAGAALLRREFSYGLLLVAMGRTSEGIAQLEAARIEDPLNGAAALNLLGAYEIARQFDRAEAMSREISGGLFASNHAVLRGTDVVRAMSRGDRQRVREALPAAIAADAMGAALNAPMLAYMDDPVRARRELRRLLDEPVIAESVFALAGAAQWAAFLGDMPLAVESLRRLERLGVPLPPWGITLWRPVSAGLRGEPGFKRLLRDLGLVRYWQTSGNWGDFCKPAGGDDFECR